VPFRLFTELFFSVRSCYFSLISFWFAVMSCVSNDHNDSNLYVVKCFWSSSGNPIHTHLISVAEQDSFILRDTLLIWPLKLSRCNSVWQQSKHLIGRWSSIFTHVDVPRLRKLMDFTGIVRKSPKNPEHIRSRILLLCSIDSQCFLTTTSPYIFTWVVIQNCYTLYKAFI